MRGIEEGKEKRGLVVGWLVGWLRKGKGRERKEWKGVEGADCISFSQLKVAI